MKKEKSYYAVQFSAEVLEEAYKQYLARLHLSEEEFQDTKRHSVSFELTLGDEKWNFDSFDEFLADYPNASSFTLRFRTYRRERSPGGMLSIHGFSVLQTSPDVRVEVELEKRADVQSVFRIFDKHQAASSIKLGSGEDDEGHNREPLKVFVGHGHDHQWRDLKDHLQDYHDIKVTAYEIGPRAGLTVKEVLEEMLNESSFALLVLTGEDIDNEGELHARENVIHEVGLFQGRLGFRRAIVLLEKGCKEFSNIHGLNQVRFSKGNIRETFGDIIATLHRELKGGD